jgi:phage antirepressor YoqD-like protein
MSAVRLNKELLERGILFSQSGVKLPKHKYIKEGLYELKFTVDKNNIQRVRPMISSKGIDFIHRLLG